MEGIHHYLPHLFELRIRFIRCILAFIIVCIPLIFFSNELYSWVAKPLLANLPAGGQLIATHVISPFSAPLKLALFSALLICIPYMLYHLWSFIAPALYPKEKPLIGSVLFSSVMLFYCGMIFAHFAVLPIALKFFANMAPKGVTVMTDITHFLDFALGMYFAFGLAFQVPIVTFLVIRAGITSVESLKKQRPYFIVGAFIIGMLLTPPDVVSQILMALPLLGLFEGGLILAQCFPGPKTELMQNDVP